MSGLKSANQNRSWSCGEARLASTGILPVSSFPVVVTGELYRYRSYTIHVKRVRIRSES
jgi:hypothetical protein